MTRVLVGIFLAVLVAGPPVLLAQESSDLKMETIEAEDGATVEYVGYDTYEQEVVDMNIEIEGDASGQPADSPLFPEEDATSADATTIEGDLTTHGDLEVSGYATMSEDITVERLKPTEEDGPVSRGEESEPIEEATTVPVRLELKE